MERQFSCAQLQPANDDEFWTIHSCLAFYTDLNQMLSPCKLLLAQLVLEYCLLEFKLVRQFTSLLSQNAWEKAPRKSLNLVKEVWLNTTLYLQKKTHSEVYLQTYSHWADLWCTQTDQTHDGFSVLNCCQQVFKLPPFTIQLQPSSFRSNFFLLISASS